MKIRACTTLDLDTHSALKQLCYRESISIDKMLAKLITEKVTEPTPAPTTLVNNPGIIDVESGTIGLDTTEADDRRLHEGPVSSMPNRW